MIDVALLIVAIGFLFLSAGISISVVIKVLPKSKKNIIKTNETPVKNTFEERLQEIRNFKNSYIDYPKNDAFFYSSNSIPQRRTRTTKKTISNKD